MAFFLLGRLFQSGIFFVGLFLLAFVFRHVFFLIDEDCGYHWSLVICRMASDSWSPTLVVQWELLTCLVQVC